MLGWESEYLMGQCRVLRKINVDDVAKSKDDGDDDDGDDDVDGDVAGDDADEGKDMAQLR